MPETPQSDVEQETQEVNPASHETDTPADTDTQQPDTEADWRQNFDPEKAMSRIRKIQSENKNLRDRAKTAEEKAAEAEQTAQQAAELQGTVLRYQVGYELGLPAELVGRLQGKDRDELVADAEKLLSLVAKPAAPVRRPVDHLRPGAQPAKEPEETDLDKIAASMFRN